MDVYNDGDDRDASDEVLATLIQTGMLPGVELGDSSHEEGAPCRLRFANKNRSFAECDARFDRLYFSEYYVYDEYSMALKDKGFFLQRQNVAKKRGISPKIGVIFALRVMEYRKSFEKVDEIFEQSYSYVRKSVLSFTDEVLKVFGAEYLRSPRENDLGRIMGINERRGFTGYGGNLKCQHWDWKNFLVAWAGQFKGKEKKPTVVLNAIADGELWIWGCHFGKNGSMNDIDVVDTSPIFTAIL